jgi:hypothetical protein
MIATWIVFIAMLSLIDALAEPIIVALPEVTKIDFLGIYVGNHPTEAVKSCYTTPSWVQVPLEVV